MNERLIICPVCGYYCLGNGGMGCIDKPNLQDKPSDDDEIEAGIRFIMNTEFGGD